MGGASLTGQLALEMPCLYYLSPEAIGRPLTTLHDSYMDAQYPDSSPHVSVLSAGRSP